MSDNIDIIINKLFRERWSGDLAEGSIQEQRKQLYKTLSNQLEGYWSGHTAYHIAVDGGFLIDNKSGSDKRLTILGEIFMESMLDDNSSQ